MERGAWHAVAIVVALALMSGCASTFRPPPGGIASATIPIGAPGGAWVLAARHTVSDCGGYTSAATDRGALDDLWADFGLPGSAPAVDFGEYVVVAWGYRKTCEGCVDELVAVDLSRDGRLRPVVAPLECAGSRPRSAPFTSVAMVVAIPRARLPPSSIVAALGVTIWDRTEGVRVSGPRARDAVLNLGGAPPSEPARTETRADEDGEVVQTSRGVVGLPPPGEVAADRLADGTFVWVVRHADGGFRVLASDSPMLSDHQASGVRVVVDWSTRAGRFIGESAWDEYGTSVLGRSIPPLDRFAARRLRDDPSRVEVGERGAGRTRGQVEPRPPSPYNHRETLRASSSGSGWCSGDWFAETLRSPYVEATASTIDEARHSSEGSVVLVDAALVVAAGSPPQLCHVERETRCPPRSHRPGGVTARTEAAELRTMPGPFVATVRDGTLTGLVATRRQDFYGAWSSSRIHDAPEVRAAERASYEGVSWISRLPRGRTWEAGGGLGAGVGARGEVLAAANLRAGIRRRLFRADFATELVRGPAAVEALLGDTAGLDLRWRWFAYADEQGTLGFGTTLGVAPVFLNALGYSRVRIPSLIGLVLPEFGVMFRTASPPRPYVGFSLPVAWIVESGVFLDATVTALVSEREGPVGGASAWLMFSFGMGTL